MSDLSVQGTIYKVFDTQEITSTFTKREFVIVTDEQYPQHLKFELIKDKTSLIEEYKEGQKVTVHFNLRGREWIKGEKTSYFVSLHAWRIESESAPVSNQSAPAPESDLPF